MIEVNRKTLSDACKAPPPDWVVVLEPPLPQDHGTEVTVRCAPGFTMEGALSTQQATCQDGVLEPTGQPPSCIISMLLLCITKVCYFYV